VNPQHPVFFRVCENGGSVCGGDLAIVVDEPDRVAAPLELVQEACRLWRVALKVELHEHHGTWEASASAAFCSEITLDAWFVNTQIRGSSPSVDFDRKDE
jgi:hypothetical protein